MVERRTRDSVNDLFSYHVGTYTVKKMNNAIYQPPRIPSQQSKQAHMLHKAKNERKLGSRTKERERAERVARGRVVVRNKIK